MSDQGDQAFISHWFTVQERGGRIPPHVHLRFLRLIDQRIVGMDGFKYCRVEQAKTNRALVLRGNFPQI